MNVMVQRERLRLSPQIARSLFKVIEGGAPTIDEIKRELQERCAAIPASVWAKNFPDMQIPLGTSMESPLLPVGQSHEFDGKGNKLPQRHTVGNDAIETYLTPDGRIMEKLVHYNSDGPDSVKRHPDENLGERDENYYMWYSIAHEKIGWMNRKAAEMIRESNQIA